ncbi:hypothetical protein [Bdellovibrio sp. HCB2-146]|uniref:hypothetical protein n=1 Tax=Bdellovibrio sp. HCB2-146 TaxID=3394362 RepID=UPI0039BCADE9
MKQTFLALALILGISISAQAGKYPEFAVRTDYATFNDLNDEATDIWAQLVREYSQTGAIKRLFSASIDPRVRALHQSVAEYLASGEFVADDARILLMFGREPRDPMSKPFSPLFRQVLINIAIDRAIKIYERNNSFFFGIDRVGFNESVVCVVSSHCDRNYTPKFAFTDPVYRAHVRQFGVGKLLAARPYNDVCGSFLGSYTLASLAALRTFSIDEQMIALGLSNSTEKMIETLGTCPNISAPALSSTEAAALAVLYMKGI